MLDFHCHILPSIDDGSKDPDMSVSMLKEEMRQGVTGIVLTPHFYADMTDPDTFVRRRKESSQRLAERMFKEGEDHEWPAMLLGAEVHYYRGISRSEEIRRLCIGRSNYMLLELPFREWHPGIVDEIEALEANQDIRVIIAHIERYLDRDRKTIKRIVEDTDFLIQSNAEFFLERRTARKAMNMLKDGKIDLLGSDAHNVSSRRPDLGDCAAFIESKGGSIMLQRIEKTALEIFNEAGREIK